MNIKDNQGNTPLSNAVRSKYIEHLDVILKHNSTTSINKKYDEGKTLLHIAVLDEIIVD
ncbi:ankyrin repeats family protein [Orientia tsutsugamushi str. Gilliam]|uniref:Ankyrin n=1 Tax=Orientia tsutsugamushi str. Gilliam TaxID=1359184 RepID=A0A0F3MC59_ORITS|nr:hypothetical protein [Orientia tsutsugamushi]KJV53373.1 ankyrin repeats family protein [Orientia tsutsugamushi str. Gilliam]SPR11338.1 ankyrin [Orientia tsutsugamushi str. Gilliam]